MVEKDGKFFTKATVLKAAPLTDELPDFLEGADITHNEDGSWSIKTSWGEVISGKPGEAYWVLYGVQDDGSVDANILTKGEVGYDDYFVCDEDGNIQGKLCELDG